MHGDSSTSDYTVQFACGAFTIDQYPIGTYDEREIIGNIYENPELIGKYPESFKAKKKQRPVDTYVSDEM